MSNSEMIRQKIVEAIQGEDALKNIVIACDTEVEGRTASYPVDLYLNFHAENGVHYKIIMQTQNVDQELNKNELFHFANIVQDVSGQVMGVIFTQPVYDKLVQDVAKDVGIMLYEMRNLADKPVWEASITDVLIDVDKEWVKLEKEKHQLADTPLQSSGNPKYMFLYDENELCLDSIEGIFNEHIRAQQEAENFSAMPVYHSFEDKNIYLKTEHELISRIRIKGIGFTVQFRNVTALDGTEIVRNILRTAVRAKLN